MVKPVKPRSAHITVRLENDGPDGYGRKLMIRLSAAERKALEQQAGDYRTGSYVRHLMQTAAPDGDIEKAARTCGMKPADWGRTVILAAIGYTPLVAHIQAATRSLRHMAA